MSSGENSNPFEDILNIATQYVTVGLVGYDKKGFKAGVTTEGVKEVTGANAAEEANDMARQQAEEAKAAGLQDRANAQLQNQQNQIAASNAATAARKTTGAPRSSTKTSTPIGDTTDFLGL